MTDEPYPSVMRRGCRGSAQMPLSLMVVVVLLVLLIAVGQPLSDRFATSRNFLNVFQQAAGLGIVSLGQTLVVLTGGIDLSVGAMISLHFQLHFWLDRWQPAARPAGGPCRGRYGGGDRLHQRRPHYYLQDPSPYRDARHGVDPPGHHAALLAWPRRARCRLSSRRLPMAACSACRSAGWSWWRCS